MLQNIELGLVIFAWAFVATIFHPGSSGNVIFFPCSFCEECLEPFAPQKVRCVLRAMFPTCLFDLGALVVLLAPTLLNLGPSVMGLWSSEGCWPLVRKMQDMGES
ncbi:hypothetical protein NC653_017975 [Populus alba x Populus x berolinensis]|uniref:Uncharacterized protein n=1 Tax=Populus alba x Populus x berolinensis TaxID=444605 RepID=A0AAD6W1B5_9ROSI|nr:hypothetical protein NC653_017975 [Populus alba x Populus x berolinensis]